MEDGEVAIVSCHIHILIHQVAIGVDVDGEDELRVGGNVGHYHQPPRSRHIQGIACE